MGTERHEDGLTIIRDDTGCCRTVLSGDIGVRVVRELDDRRALVKPTWRVFDRHVLGDKRPAEQARVAR